MDKINGHLTAGPWTVWGATAEVLSVLEGSPLWAKFDPGGGGINEGRVGLTATCILNRDPYRNIPYDEFQKKTVRSVDKKCREFGESIPGASARRHGQVKNPGSSMDIVVEGVPGTAEAAAAVGELLASISRTTE